MTFWPTFVVSPVVGLSPMLTAYVHAGLKKLTEKDDDVERLQEVTGSCIKLADDVPTVIAEDAVSQVVIHVLLGFNQIFTRAFYSKCRRRDELPHKGPSCLC